jgi:hypothetical protein
MTGLLGMEDVIRTTSERTVVSARPLRPGIAIIRIDPHEGSEKGETNLGSEITL